MASVSPHDAMAWWENYRREVLAFWTRSPIEPAQRCDYLIAEYERAVATGDEDRVELLIDVALWEESSPGLEALQRLVVSPGHGRHQELVRSLQLSAHASSVPFLCRAFDADLQLMHDRSCSSHGAIAKWFSHAFADIGTPEAIAALRHYARSHPQPEVREEMNYRLGKLNPDPDR